MHINNCAIAPDFCQQAMSEMQDRAASRDCDGERSMERTVKAFNAMFGHKLTTIQGWQFMELLKMARSVGGVYREDDFVDAVAYAALAGEAAADAAHEASREKQCIEGVQVAKDLVHKPSLPAGSFVEGDPNGGQLSSS